MANKNTIRVRITNEKNGSQSFKALVIHPMETGYRKDPKNGELVPADYIEHIQVSIDGVIYFDTTFSENVSKTPFLHFGFSKDVSAKEFIMISWSDNFKNYYSETFKVTDVMRSVPRNPAAVGVRQIKKLSPGSLPVCSKQFPSVTK